MRDVESYIEGVRDSADFIRQYAEDTHEDHSKFTACPRCDIMAALRVAAERLEKSVK